MASICFSIICFLGCLAGAGGFFAARRAFRERSNVVITAAETECAEREATASTPSAPPPPPPSPHEAPRPAQ
eukprot:11039596-Alexandrium_andersonii.AAC.1